MNSELTHTATFLRMKFVFDEDKAGFWIKIRWVFKSEILDEDEIVFWIKLKVKIFIEINGILDKGAIFDRDG